MPWVEERWETVENTWSKKEQGESLKALVHTSCQGLAVPKCLAAA